MGLKHLTSAGLVARMNVVKKNTLDNYKEYLDPKDDLLEIKPIVDLFPKKDLKRMAKHYKIPYDETDYSAIKLINIAKNSKHIGCKDGHFSFEPNKNQIVRIAKKLPIESYGTFRDLNSKVFKLENKIESPKQASLLIDRLQDKILNKFREFAPKSSDISTGRE
jgi:hypothetical protein